MKREILKVATEPERRILHAMQERAEAAGRDYAAAVQAFSPAPNARYSPSGSYYYQVVEEEAPVAPTAPEG